MRSMTLIFPVFLLVSLPPVHDFAKVLYLPFPLPAAITRGTWLEEDLHKLGHQLWIAHPSAHAPPSFDPSRRITFTSLDGEDLESLITGRQIQHFLHNDEYKKNLPDTYTGISANIKDLLQDVLFPDKAPRFVQDKIQEIRDTLRDDKGLLESIIKEKFDLVLVDHELDYQGVLVQNGLAFIYISEYPDELIAGLPAHPGLTPAPGSFLTEQMTLLQRVHNTVLYVARGVATSISQRQNEDLVNSQERRMWLVMQDILVDYQRPSMPNVKYIGGMSLRKSNKLSKKVQEFYDKATDIVVVSLGVNFENIKSDYSEKMIQAFASTKYSFIVSSNTTSSKPERFLAMSKLDEIDLLAQSKTKLLVTHCDINSQYEAISQGIPVLCIPTTRTLYNNALRLENKRYGSYVLLNDCTADDIANAITLVLQRPEFQRNVARAAKLLQGKPMTGRQEAAYWIDHVIQHGDSHFRSPHLQWYSHLCLDISLVFVTFIALMVYLLNIFVKWSLPGFFRESDRRKEKSE